MGFDTMRSGHARCPSYLVAGLLLMCFLLACNWWSLSTQNHELLKQMDDMGDQLNICSDERVICVSRRNGIETQLREAESRIAEIKTIEVKNEEDIRRYKSDISDHGRSAEKAKQDLTYCQTELESLKKVDASKMTTLASMRLENEGLTGQLKDAKEKIKELENSLRTAKPLSGVSNSKLPPNMPQYSSSTVPQKKGVKAGGESQDGSPYHVGNEGPVQGGTHELDGDMETAIDNAAIEDIDDLNGIIPSLTKRLSHTFKR